MLIVNYDETDPDKFLRYVGVIVEEEIGSGDWLAAHSGIYLPRGVYFVPRNTGSPPTSAFTFDSAWPAEMTDDDEDEDMPDMRSEYVCTINSSVNAIGPVEYPVKGTVRLDASTGNVQDWIGFQFGPDGNSKKAAFSACSGPGGIVWNQIVLGLASIQPDGILLFEGSDKTVGIALRANGISFAVDDSNAL